MKILVTGSSSFIGEVLCPMLENAGHEVYKFDLKYMNDICDERQLYIAMRPVQAIIHLAACSTPALCEANPALAYRVNIDAVKTINKLRGEKPIFFPNTNIGYGAKEKLPVYDETSPMHPNSVYGKTKCEGEKLILEHGNAVVFRLASLFGCSPSMRWNLLLNFMVKEAYEKGVLQIYEGHVRRNFLHVKDMCGAFIHAIDNYDTMKNQVYNVGIESVITKIELAYMIKHYLPNMKIETMDGQDPDKRDYVITNKKLMATGWKPEIGLKDGVQELIGVLRG